MPRPEKKRRVLQPPLVSDFKPTGIPRGFLETLEMTIDEYEAIRLADYLGYDHETASIEMKISRPTFSRLIEKARHKIAKTIVDGLYLKIAGGSIHFQSNRIHCKNCKKTFQVPLDNPEPECPTCGSKDLIDLATRLGHGDCCRDFKF
jgi:predicted DNA-binding protein (UPF0251 family)